MIGAQRSGNERCKLSNGGVPAPQSGHCCNGSAGKVKPDKNRSTFASINGKTRMVSYWNLNKVGKLSLSSSQEHIQLVLGDLTHVRGEAPARCNKAPRQAAFVDSFKPVPPTARLGPEDFDWRSEVRKPVGLGTPTK